MVESDADRYTFRGSPETALVRTGGFERKSFISEKLVSHSFVHSNLFALDAS